jgi:hypothetical protein
MKMPLVSIPVNLYLELARAYKEQPVECIHSVFEIHITELEQRAYRKFLNWKKVQRKELVAQLRARGLTP